MLLSNEQIKAAFAGTESFAAIARRAGVSREYIRQVYQQRFADLFPNRNNIVRLKRISEMLLEALASHEERWTDAAIIAANAARRAGCKVEPIVCGLQGDLGKLAAVSNMVLIDGHTCVCHIRRDRFSIGGRRTGLYHVMITRTQHSAFHVLIAGKNIFVVPTEVLHRYYVSRSVYVPTKQPVRPTKLDWWQYKAAWWQLKN